MAYKIQVNLRAQFEIEKAFDWYKQRSLSAGGRFLTSIESAYQALQLNPYFQLQYRNIRAIKLRRFPYTLFFTVDETESIVRVLSCFHQHRNPSSKP